MDSVACAIHSGRFLKDAVTWTDTNHALSPAVVQLAARIPREHRMINAHP